MNILIEIFQNTFKVLSKYFTMVAIYRKWLQNFEFLLYILALHKSFIIKILFPIKLQTQ